MGNLFDFCVEKNPHLPVDDPRRKYKARVVFQGNRVINQDWEAAMFQDLGNAPATMEASRIIDCYRCLPRHIEEQSDARQAYSQAFLNGTPLGPVSLKNNGIRFGNICGALSFRLYALCTDIPIRVRIWEEHDNGAVESKGFVAIIKSSWQGATITLGFG